MWAKDHPDPWQMRGFPGKVRRLAWSRPTIKGAGAPLLASMSSNTIVVWTKAVDTSAGWEHQLLEAHEDSVEAIAFRPKSLVLASAAEDGRLHLWNKSRRIVQTLKGASDGFSCLAWSRAGNMLAAGGSSGELWVWSEMNTGKGFK
ncbi:MAG: hypothetical protein AAGG02_20685 [Cyanobacteria bacterium P01_H01_bin.15]